MLLAGLYKLVQHVNISESLLSQRNGPPKQTPHTIHKSILERDGLPYVVYFLGVVEFGPKSELEIASNKAVPLLKEDDYRILRRHPYSHSTKLAEQLLRNAAAM